LCPVSRRSDIYTNTAGQVVLVREREWNEEEDAFVLISREHAIKVAHAILEAPVMATSSSSGLAVVVMRTFRSSPR
jgi:hypothetical protein